MSDQQPPSGSGTPAGFYPDSTGSMRWWDGAAWTEQTQQPAPGQVAMAAPPKKKHTVRNVLLGLVAVFVLFVGGCMALIGSAANEVSKSIDKEVAKDSEPGGPDNPLTISEGKAFSVSGFDYAAGWKVVDNEFGFDITKLKVTNNRDDKDSALVEIKFMKGSEVLALTDCTTEPVAVGQTTTLSCLSGDDLPAKYDKITINDTF
ncbi:DUF2510 domain-containing protein [Aeromicrobium sp. A1-2]|uniref:DUF2510 domain-containing protein n=1 Tax=Aeromicrobium sp. A1-2 TaxID=2107713 RepID=UPI001C1F9E22|nr:DUF2510 domain-containing protein [Aeromicrobium sp. A1-2]